MSNSTSTLGGSPYNWQYIDKNKFPVEYNNINIKEDFNLLFNDHSIDHYKLKETLRSSIREPNQTVRKYLWKRILFCTTATTTTTTITSENTKIKDLQQYDLVIQKYEEKLNKMFGKSLDIKADLPSFVDNHHLLYYYLNDAGKLAAKRVLCILQSVHPDITYSPTLLPLVSLFLHYMSESDAYALIMAVVESGDKITQTDIHWNTTSQVFRRLAKRYCNTSYEYVLHATYKTTNSLEKSSSVIDDWYWWILEYLPFNYILNIIDSYLLEGQKVLYRFGIAILDLFVKYFMRKPAQLDLNCINIFCRQMPIQIERLNKTAFSLRNMSRKDVKILFDIEEKNIKSLRLKVAANDLVANRRKSAATLPNGETLLAAIKTTNIGSGVNTRFTLSTKKRTWKNPFKNIKPYNHQGSGKKRQVLSYRNHANSCKVVSNLPTFSVENTGSKILTAEEIVQIWRWLPARWQLLELEIVYSTDIHGCRLMTLFDKTEFYQATIIIIKPVGNDCVFGAFCSQPWSNRFSNNGTTTYKYLKPSFFGTGETFLFQLRPTMIKYDWIGKNSQGDTTTAQELFLYADNKTLIVGSGGNGNGLEIDENLQYGVSKQCETFANDPLCGDANINFEIAVLEVLSFKCSNG